MYAHALSLQCGTKLYSEGEAADKSYENLNVQVYLWE
jgi:hypothetical protein